MFGSTLTAFCIVSYFHGAIGVIEPRTTFDIENTTRSTLERLIRENDARHNNHKENFEKVATAIVAAQERTNATVELIVNKHDRKILALGASDAKRMDPSICRLWISSLDKDAEYILLSTTMCTNNVTIMVQEKYDTSIILYKEIMKSLTRLFDMFYSCFNSHGKYGDFPNTKVLQSCVKLVSKAIYRFEDYIESHRMFVPNSGFDSFSEEQSALAKCDATDKITSLRAKAEASYAETKACMVHASTIQKPPIY